MALALQAGSNPRLRALRPRFRLLPDWSTPLLYAVAALAFGTAVPRLEHQWFPGLFNPITAPIAIAIDSSVASGMLALTGIVFALAFVTVQFGAIAYSPRLVSWIARDPFVMHAIGIFTATFLYALAALAWVDRAGSGRVPFLSSA